MNIVVLIGGVHDPKWPIALGDEGSAIPAAENQVLSPFDEAALEVALRIRDAICAAPREERRLHQRRHHGRFR